MVAHSRSFRCVLLLALLQLMDSFKLVRLPAVVAAIAAGRGRRAARAAVHDWADRRAPASSVGRSARYVAPVTEETLKALFIVFLCGAGASGSSWTPRCRASPSAPGSRSSRTSTTSAAARRAAGAVAGARPGHGGPPRRDHGDLRDGVEDADGPLDRSHALALRARPGARRSRSIRRFNHLPLPPLAMTLAAPARRCLPLIVIVFQRSEAATRDWVGAGLDLDVELLELVALGASPHTRFGTYLRELRAAVPGPWWPTCSACCGSSSSCRCRPRRC